MQEFLRGEDRCSWSVVHHGEVNELLVITVFAHKLAFGGNGHELRMCIKLRQDVFSRELAERQTFDDVGVSQHAL